MEEHLQTVDSQRSLWMSGMHPVQHLIKGKHETKDIKIEPVLAKKQERLPEGTLTL